MLYLLSIVHYIFVKSIPILYFMKHGYVYDDYDGLFATDNASGRLQHVGGELTHSAKATELWQKDLYIIGR